tara:strand:- start:774 stop:1247 length:474 start_codon:yes stop_codon:yes gene_type:complete
MDNIPGISKIKEPTEPTDAPAPVRHVEDTQMSISHLLLKGFVVDVVKEGRFEAKFKSLKTDDVHRIDSIVILHYGTEEHRASRSARYMKYLAESLEYIYIEDGDAPTVWDFSSLDATAKEEALKEMSSYIFNSLFSMYLKFEGLISDMISEVNPKNS